MVEIEYTKHLVRKLVDGLDVRDDIARGINEYLGPLSPERFYKPLLDTLIQYGAGSEIEMLCSSLVERYWDPQDPDSSVKALIRRGRKAVLKCFPHPFYPDTKPAETWWAQDYGEDPAVEVLPGTVIRVEPNDDVTVPATYVLKVAYLEGDGYLSMVEMSIQPDEVRGTSGTSGESFHLAEGAFCDVVIRQKADEEPHVILVKSPY